MTSNNPRRTYLLDDIPSSEDAFASDGSPGPHQRVANAIVELVTSPNEQGGKMVGLEGGWGAGKSTVVKFIRNELSELEKFTVITFDAWAHEGDPLRRTFLETVICALQKRNWVDKDHWEKKKEEIANRRKVIDTKIIPKTTTLGTVIGVATFCVPAGVAFLATALENGISFSRNSKPELGLIIGGILSFAPLLVLLAKAVWLLLKLPPSWSRFTKLENWSFLEGNSISNERTETVETPDPTSIEFENYFSGAMKEALSLDTNRRLLLVLDNLDRVDPEDALIIWSTLQTFLQECGFREESWFKQLWVLVPYDPNGLRKLWDNSHGRSQSDSVDRLDEDKPVSDEYTDDYRLASDSFLDKSFQVRFNVPPPVLSDWKSYLYALVEKALPDHREDERHMLYRVFEYCRRNAEMPPTPRELKLYVNQVGAIHRQWGDEFPVGHVAYFIFQCRNHASIIHKLQSNRFPEPNALRLLGEELRPNLAGLAFNAPAEKGMELLLTDPIYQCLMKGNHDELRTLEKRHADGFWAILEIVVEMKIHGADPLVIASAGRCLAQSEILRGNQRLDAQSIRSEIRLSAEATKSWLPFDEEMALGIAAHCRIQDDLSFSEIIGNSISLTLAAPVTETDSPDVEAVVVAILTVLRCMTDLGHTNAIPQPLTLPLDAMSWIFACESLMQNPDDQLYWQYVSPSAEFAEISKAIVDDVSGGEFGQKHITAVKVTDACPMKSNWDEVVEAMTARLNAGKASKSPEVRSLLEGLWELRSRGSEESVNSLSALVSGGHVMHHFHHAIAQKDQQCQVICILTSLREAPTSPTPAVAGNSAGGHAALTDLLESADRDVAIRMVTILRNYNELGMLFTIADAREEPSPLIDECQRVVAESDSPHELFSGNAILTRWPAIQKAVNTEEDKSAFDSLIAKLSTDYNLCQDIQDGKHGFSVDDAALYWTIVEKAGGDISSFLDWCKDGLEKMDAEGWRADLSGSCDCVWLAYSIADEGVLPKFTTNLADMLEEHAGSLANGKDFPEEVVVTKWQDLLGFLDENIRTDLRPRILSVAVAANGSIHENYFRLYGSEIADGGLLSNNDKAIPNLLEALVRENNLHGLRWMKDFFEKNGTFLDSVSSQSAVSVFKTRLHDRLVAGGDDEAQKLIESIAKMLEIEIPNVEEDNEEPGRQGPEGES